MALLKLLKSKDLKCRLNEESDWLFNMNFQPKWVLPRPHNEINLSISLSFVHNIQREGAIRMGCSKYCQDVVLQLQIDAHQDNIKMTNQRLHGFSLFQTSKSEGRNNYWAFRFRLLYLLKWKQQIKPSSILSSCPSTSPSSLKPTSAPSSPLSCISAAALLL